MHSSKSTLSKWENLGLQFLFAEAQTFLVIGEEDGLFQNRSKNIEAPQAFRDINSLLCDALDGLRGFSKKGIINWKRLTSESRCERAYSLLKSILPRGKKNQERKFRSLCQSCSQLAQNKIQIMVARKELRQFCRSILSFLDQQRFLV